MATGKRESEVDLDQLLRGRESGREGTITLPDPPRSERSSRGPRRNALARFLRKFSGAGAEGPRSRQGDSGTGERYPGD